MIGFVRLKLAWLPALAVVALSLPAMAREEVVISDDGRQIRLNGDGSWVQLSRDRYATTASGQRVRLKPDGTWSTMDAGDAVASEGRAGIAPANDSTLYLNKVEILKRNIKRAKSIHAETRTVYEVQVVNETDAPIQLQVDLVDRLRAFSSSGANFPIESVSFERDEIAPGERGMIRVVAAGAPKWTFGVRHLALEVDAQTLGNADKRILSKNMNEVERRNVERL